jgi:hypothetical protein
VTHGLPRPPCALVLASVAAGCDGDESANGDSAAPATECENVGT